MQGCLFEVLPIVSYDISKEMRQLVEQKTKRTRTSSAANANATFAKAHVVHTDQHLYADKKNRLQEELKRENESNAKTLEEKIGTFVQVILL